MTLRTSRSGVRNDLLDAFPAPKGKNFFSGPQGHDDTKLRTWLLNHVASYA